MINSLKQLFLIALLLLSSVVDANTTFNKIQLEDFFRDRVKEVVHRVDPNALVRVEIKLKKVQSVAPLLGYELDVTPLESDRSIGPESIQQINVNIVSELTDQPEWIKKEIKRSVILESVRVNIVYEKADQPLVDPSTSVSSFVRGELFELIKDSLKQVISSASWIKYGIWGLVLFSSIALGVIAAGLFGFSRRIEEVLKKIVDEKIAPALSSMNLSGVKKTSASLDSAEGGSASSVAIANASLGSRDEFQDFSTPSLRMLFTDCYWTKKDGYAHYIWSLLKNSQREELLKSDFVDPEYFSFFKTAAPENLGYHNDVVYLSPKEELSRVNQEDLLKWVKSNLAMSWVVSPLRLDFLDLSLEERIKMFTQPQKKSVAVTSVPKLTSPLRELPPQFRIKKLTLKDEEFLWDQHHQVPSAARFQLSSLVWLGLASEEYRKNVFADLDARQIAEAWSAPEVVLEKFKEVIPPKKLEMVEHFIATTEPDRSGEVYQYLVEAGQTAKQEETSSTKAA